MDTDRPSAAPSVQRSAGTGLASARVVILRSQPIDHDKRTQQMARILADAGVAVTVIAVSPLGRTYRDAGGFDVVEAAAVPASNSRSRLVRVGSNIVRNWIRPWSLGRVISRHVRAAAPDIIHCMNLDTLEPGLKAAGGAKLVYDAREHFPSTGDVSADIKAQREQQERRLVRRVDAVLTVSDPIADDLAERYEIPRPTVIYNGPTCVVASPTDVHSPLRLIHLGKFFRDRNLGEVIDVVGQLDGACHLTLQGWGEAEAELRDEIRERGLEELISIVPPCAPDEIVEAISSQDVGIINFRPDNDSFRWSAPNKLFDYMAAGLCLLVSDLPFMRRVVTDADCGVVFPPGLTGLLEVCRHLVVNPEEVMRLKRNAVTAASQYSWDAQAQKLYAVYRQVLGDS